MTSLEKIVADLVEKVESRCYGKYRGFVVNNADPEQLGRLKVRVPSLLSAEVVTGWALPCAPYGGDSGQGFLFIPEVGAGVWVEFEAGDLEFPIWTGTFWSKPSGDSELPKPNDAAGAQASAVQDPPTRKIIKTKAGHTIQFEDAADQEMITIIEGVNKHMIKLDQNSITLTVGNNKLVVDKGGIMLGDANATEPLLLGMEFKQKMLTLLTDLMTHQHVATSMGGPTTPPTKPLSTDVATAPLSSKHYLDK